MTRLTDRQIWNQHIAYGVTKMKPDVIAKLEHAFAIDATREQACDYADIDPSTLWRWEQKYPELCKKFERMRQRLPLKAKENIALRIHGQPTLGDTELSKWFLEKKEKGYVPKLELVSPDLGEPLDDISKEQAELDAEYDRKQKELIKKRWAAS